jgi:peptidoglycan/LPS O-acetylase OafA/YrhL
LIAASNNRIAMVTLAVLALTSQWWPRADALPHALPIFAVGMVVFRYRFGLTSARLAVCATVTLASLLALSDGLELALIAGITAMMIGSVDARRTWIGGFLGRISYSLYLLHNPVGFPVMLLVGYVAHGTVGTPYPFLAAMIASVGTAWLFARAIEWPAKRWAAAIQYRPTGNTKPHRAGYRSAGLQGTSMGLDDYQR